ncbi:MAG: Extracellular ligand-binding receptor [Hyphomicrobiales bacterium]|nr:Extracellular ligand-binding receptor [Hyphomicrobiales bacterium]
MTASNRDDGQRASSRSCGSWPLLAGAFAAALSLAGCGPSGYFGGPAASVQPPAAPSPIAQATGDALGSGPTKIGLVLPLTQADGPSTVGQSLRNAAELAISESGGSAVTVIVKDDQSTPEGARAAAQAAIDEGAQIVIGPLYANNVREVGRIARGAGKPVIAFSTDATTGSPGVYLLSFLVEGYVDRIVEFAASRGKKSVAALAPESDYGNVAIAQFQQAAANRGVRVQAIERYRPGGALAAAQKIAALGAQIDALFIPEQADQMAAVSQALSTAGVDVKRVQVLGTGLWNDARVLRLPQLQGAWFAAPENGGFNAFAGKYRAKFNSDPTRISTLAYDAVSLAAALAGMQGGQGFTSATLTNSSGFNGADGLFRFRPDGQNERGLSVLQIRTGATSVVSPAPRTFGPQNGGT